MNSLPGVAGTLFPGRYLVDRLPLDSRISSGAAEILHDARRFQRWWTSVERTCGPASGLRAVFDLAAMPLFAMLGFRARHAVFEETEVRARLDTPNGTAVALVLLPWAERPSALWREVFSAAREIDATWCFLLAPPFLSLVDARGRATRRSLEFTFPAAFSESSFAPFWTLTRAPAFDPPAKSDDHASHLGKLVALAGQFQDGVREDLQHGVADALRALSGVMHHAAPRPRRSVPGGPTRPTPNSAADEALIVIYRILFLLFAESRGLVPHAHPIYRQAYALGSLCREALDGRTPGLWESLAAITRLSRRGCRTDDLVVTPFNGHLFARAAAPSLEAGRSGRRPRHEALVLDAAMHHALVALGSRRGRAGREEISYRDLGVEQLGAVYERVLDLTPNPNKTRTARQAALTAPPARRNAGHSAQRKQSGTFYTPQSLAEFVVRRTLAPLVAGLPADAILALRVVDPAMGSGAFLVAACNYISAAYERALIDEGRIAPGDLDEHERANTRRLIAGRCLAGVDRNPVAVQLGRLSLWLTTLARGKPLGFLDHRLRVGDSLIGASPDDLVRTAVGRPGRGGSLPLFETDRLEDTMRRIVGPLEALRAPDDTVKAVRAKEVLWRRLTSEDSPLDAWRTAAHVWCARWFWPVESGEPPSPGELRAIQDALLKGDRTLPASHMTTRLASAIAIARRRAFFHWPLEFADVFYDDLGRPKPNGGFDAVIGNPPWEMVRDETHTRAVDGATTGAGSSGNRRIVRFIRESGLYPSCDRGHVNLYQPFVERALSLTRPGGRIGLILPWGFAADDGAATLRTTLLDRASVDTIVGLDNAAAMFPIHRGLRFLTLIASRGQSTRRIRARFGVKTAEELDDLPGRDDDPASNAYPLRLTPPQIAAIGGPARRIPDARRPGDIEFLERLSASFPPLGSTAGWGARFGRELNATEDRDSFGDRGLPVIEGKHLAPFEVHAERSNTRIDRSRALKLLADARFERPRLGYRDVSGAGNRVSLIGAIIPGGVVTTHTIFCLRTRVSAPALHFLCGLFNSYVLNAVVRLLMGGHLTTSLIENLPVPAWRADRLQLRIAVLARQLSARSTAPSTHARLQASVAELYGVDGKEFRRILDGFPLVPREERDRAAEAQDDG